MCRRYQNLVELLEQKRNEMELMGKEFEVEISLSRYNGWS